MEKWVKPCLGDKTRYLLLWLLKISVKNPQSELLYVFKEIPMNVIVYKARFGLEDQPARFPKESRPL